MFDLQRRFLPVIDRKSGKNLNRSYETTGKRSTRGRYYFSKRFFFFFISLSLFE